MPVNALEYNIMSHLECIVETLKKTIYVPLNHKLQFDLTLPTNFPTGETEVVLIFAPKTSSQAFSENYQELVKLAGKLKNSVHFKGDPLELQKELRNEWKN